MSVATFKNTITSLPYGYQLRHEFYSDCGATYSGTATNGGYVRITNVKEEIDLFTGVYKPGALTLELRDIGGIFTDYIFKIPVANAEYRLWVSYDSDGTSPRVWQCLFFGFIASKKRTRTDKHDTNVASRIYSVEVDHAFNALREIDVDFVSNPITSNTYVRTMPLFSTDNQGNPLGGWTGGRGYGADTSSVTFVQVREILNYICGSIPFIAGLSETPTVTIDTTACEHKAWNANTAAEYGFSSLYVHYDNDKTAYKNLGLLQSHFMPGAGPVSAYDAKNLQELLKRWCNQLLIIPVARMTETAGVVSVTVYFEPLIRNSASISAVSGSLGSHMERQFEIMLWFDGFQTMTPGLLVPSIAPGSYGGNVLEVRNYLCTSPDLIQGTSIDPYIFTETWILATGYQPVNNKYIAAQQLYIKDGGATRMAHKFKHATAQTVKEVSQTGYYGVQFSIYDLMWDGVSMTVLMRSEREGWSVRYKTMRGTDLWDLRLLKKVVIQSKTCLILSIDREPYRNSATIKAIELVA